ncbi:PTS glucose transporter subunit IIB [Metamycoplasma canadense]|uniref:PTS EIIB type-1 domain-containing protein n=1 Tax=Metamycoplasma canadense TaxID=29554 RepID=A0A077L9E8_9BACT|nr:PTS glucose transporter subunit IIB [Metamycoplasma canadense]BAP39668.1 hypothetical protein MCAN360_0563 [Metamycoplasma canadense]
MNSKNKALYIILIIVTLGFIIIYWQKKYRQSKIKNYLSKNTKLDFDFETLIKYLGGKDNIENVSSTHKILKINFLNRDKLSILKLKQLNGISGLTIQSKSISLVVGNTAKHIEELINGAK